MRITLLVGLAALALGAAAQAQDAAPAPVFVQAVEFPYYLYPRAQWERELVWLKTIGVRTVEFSIPWNWHQLRPGEFDFTGRTSPRRDLTGFLRILRKLDFEAWVRPLPPVSGWANNGWPAGYDVARPNAGAKADWLKQLGELLAAQTNQHGGPVAFVEGGDLEIDAAPAPVPVTTISTTDASALARSWAAITAAHGAVLWTNLEDALYPAGWEATGVAFFRRGAVDLSGTERPPTAALRRSAALLEKWGPLLPALKHVAMPPPAVGRLPRGVSAAELVSAAVSAVSVVNRSRVSFHDDLRVVEPASKHVMVIPGVTVPPGETLWMPLNVTLGENGLCRECSFFSAAERVVYATAELLTVEFENGILAMEFAAPASEGIPAQVVLQFQREPVGPYIAAGKPTKFDWDEKTMRATLTIPVGKDPGGRVRVGLAIEAPETAGFINDAKRLVIGQQNPISTEYSSADVAARSRLRVPEGFTATPALKSPNEIDYSVQVPSDALHGEWASLVLEADGVPLGRARLQMFRPASIRLEQAFKLHFGPQTALQIDPAIATADARSGGNLEIVIRNNSPQIQNYRLSASGEGLEFSPARSEIAIAGVAERSVSLRVFPDGAGTGLHEWVLHVTGGATLDLPFRVVLIPRDGTAIWSADLDGDGSNEWVIESQKVRAVFSSGDGGRWMEFVWKDTNTNFLPLEGALARAGTVDVEGNEGSLHFRGKGWTRTVSLAGDTLTIEQSPSLPADLLPPQAAAAGPGNVTVSMERRSPARVVYRIQQTNR
jgi:Glycosyl hydrolases family 35